MNFPPRFTRALRKLSAAVPPKLLLLSVAASALFPPPAHAAPDLAAAERMLNRGEVDRAIAQLHDITAAEPHNGPAHLLLCRAFYAYAQVDNAVAECETAAGQLRTSTALDWLGRAYGQKAEQYGPISGLSYARRVRDTFEAAAAADPHDGAALNDLSEFYINAPSVIGGGLDRARALADRSAPALPQNAHRMQAMAAEKAGDYGTAEREYRSAATFANQPAAWSDLGDFFGRRKRYRETVETLEHAVALDRSSDFVLVDCADILLAVKLRPDLSEHWLRMYLAGNGQTDAAPAFRAHTELAKLLARRGDKAAARTELDRALELASAYEPARKALRSL